MNYHALAKNAGSAFLSQGVSFLVSALMSLFVPKVLGVTEYGYWQLFIFYTTYVGFFHFGLNDGVYLLKGGQSRKEIDRRSVGSQFRFGVMFQSIIALCIAIITLITVKDTNRSFVLLFTALFLLLNNLAYYLGYVFQAMNETSLWSVSVMVDRLVFLVPLLVMVILGVNRFEPYVVAYAASKTCSLLYCLWHARDFLAAGWEGLGATFRDVRESVRVGCSLMLANVASMLVLGVARMLVDVCWGIEAFGRVSFALSIVNFFLAFMSQASMVLFPALRQGSSVERRSIYRVMRDALGLILPGVYLMYFPVAWLLCLWLPSYSQSMHYFAILLPLCVFDAKMNVCCMTYLKVLRRERVLLAVNVVAVACSVVLSAIGVFVVDSLDAVLVGVSACIAGRSLWAGRYLDERLGVPPNRESLGEIALTVAFVALALLAPTLVAVVGYGVLYGAYLAANRRVAREIARSMAKALAQGRD